MQGMIHSFESFGTVDGPSVRFVIFVQGCMMRCRYCHNPDTWDLKGGTRYESESVLQEILKYRRYIEKGGVTITGGEPMMQLDFVLELFEKCHEQGLHTCMDTSGIVYDEANPEFMEKIERLLRVCDLFLLDIKHIDPLKHQELTGQSNERPLKFAEYLSDCQKPMWIRHVLVPGYTTDEGYLKQLRKFLDTLATVERIEVLPYHQMGAVKYEKLGIPYVLKGVEPPTREQIQLAETILGCDRYGK